MDARIEAACVAFFGKDGWQHIVSLGGRAADSHRASMAKALASADPQTLHNSEAEQMRLAVALTSGDQETVNEIHGRAWYVDVCRAEQRLKEFVTACKALLDRLPAGCQSETAAALHDLVEQTDVVLRPGFFSEAQREVAFSKYGSKSVVPASADLNSQEVPRGPAP